jgi:pimeloyl-ACP methyl ester carboxylesterase
MYRAIGEGTPALVLLQHFRGNLDNWDPALVDALARVRRVVAFDNVGVGGSTGMTPNTITQMARDAIAFIDALELDEVDLLGFSIGSFVAQEMALLRPALVRRLVLASSAPRGAAGMHGWAPDVIGAVGAPARSPEGYLGVFFYENRREPPGGSGDRGAARCTARGSRRADDVAYPASPVRGRMRVGYPGPRTAAASQRDRRAGVRGQRRQ